MILTWIMFVVAISLSAVAAFYSIVGLAAIFSAAVLPIVIMGTILEIAKLTVTVWLHEYWRQCRWIMKAYLVPAVVVLMIITSMGIFGFLSKAHIDQIIPTGDRTAQLVLFDERIANERAVVENSRSLIRQMDDTVNGIIEKGESREIRLRDGQTIVRSPAELALQVRRSQSRDRDALTKTIEEAQKRIVVLQEERAPIAKEIRGLEAEVGPIKYVAALIYGDNPDTNLLERAVRWVIIILVAVFDPLAIMMLLAATESRKWYLESQRKPNQDDPIIPPEPDADPDTQPDLPRDPDPELEPVEPHVSPVADTRPAYFDSGGFGFQNLTPMVAPAPEPLMVQPKQVEETVQYQILDDDTLLDDPPTPVTKNEQAEPVFNQEFLNQLETEEREDDDDDDSNVDPRMRVAKAMWKRDHPQQTLKNIRRMYDKGMIDALPWEQYLEFVPLDPKVDFGRELPTNAIKGDFFVDVSSAPSTLWKYNGRDWVEVSKTNTDQYVYNTAYIDYLISAIAAGEYDPDLLTDSEKNEIETRLQSGN